MPRPSLASTLQSLDPRFCFDYLRNSVDEAMSHFRPPQKILCEGDIHRWFGRLEYHLTYCRNRRWCIYPVDRHHRWWAQAEQRLRRIYGPHAVEAVAQMCRYNVDGGRRGAMIAFARDFAEQQINEHIESVIDAFVSGLPEHQYKLARAQYLARYGRLLPVTTRIRVASGKSMPSLRSLLRMHPRLIHARSRFHR